MCCVATGSSSALVARHIYRLVMMSIYLSETTHFVHWKSETMSETILSDNVFQTKFNSNKKSFSQNFLGLDFAII